MRYRDLLQRQLNSVLVKGYNMEKQERTIRDVAVAALIHENKILIAQRPRGESSRWTQEFPGDAADQGEPHESCLQKELRKELDLDITREPFMGEYLSLFSWPCASPCLSCLLAKSDD